MKFIFLIITILTLITQLSCQTGSIRQLASVNNIFSELQGLTCSPEEEIGCTGLFNVHEKDVTQIGLLTNGEAGLIARIKTLKNAKKSILIQTLMYQADEIGNYIAKILIEKKKMGLDVRLIVDTFSNVTPAIQNLFYELKLAGIEVEGYETAYLGWINEVSLTDPALPNKRLHEKMWIIDGTDVENRVAIVGGMNVGNEYFRLGKIPSNIWRDQDFIVKGNIIEDMVKAFERNYQDQKDIKNSRPISTDTTWKLWREGAGKVFKLNWLQNWLQGEADPEIIKKINEIDKNADSINIPMMPARAQFFQNRPRYNETYIQQVYLKAFAQASSKKSKIVLVNAYFIPNDALVNALKTAALQGAEVIIITNSPETNDLPQMAIASRYTYKDLMSVNLNPDAKGSLKIYEWQGDNEGTIHAKFAIINGHTVIGGSYNLDPRSETLNSETVIVFENEKLADTLNSFVVDNDLRKSRLISQNEAEKFFTPTNPPDKIRLLIWNGLKGHL